MRNKLITISFGIFFSLTATAQTVNSDNNEQQPEVSIYPNPAIEYVIVELDDSFTNAKFELNSMIGNKITIQPEELGYGKYRISLKDFATGYYFLIVTDKDSRARFAHKFLKN